MAYDQLQLAPVHRNDPEESVLAARRVKANRQLEQVVLCLAQATVPMTDDQIAAAAGLLRHSAGTRRGVAVKLGYVRRAGRGVSALNNPASTWELTDLGRAMAKRMAA